MKTAFERWPRHEGFLGPKSQRIDATQSLFGS